MTDTDKSLNMHIDAEEELKQIENEQLDWESWTYFTCCASTLLFK